MRPSQVCRALVSLSVIAGRVEGTRRTVRGSSAAAASVAARQRQDADAQREQIVPDIWRSASHFYGHDLPHDFSPPADKLEKDFDHPYPVVQESAVFDKDYVKDENADDGQWKAQMDYDKLRTEVDKLASQFSRVLKKKEELEGQLRLARSKEEGIRKELKSLYNVSNPADKAIDVNASVGVGPATEEVERRLQEIERCKKELTVGQQRLKQLQQLLEAAEKEQERAQAAEKRAQAHAAAREQQAKAVDAKLKVAGQAHDSRLQAFKLQKQELEDLRSRIAEARARLTGIHFKAVDQDGGVYKTNFVPKKSSAPPAASLWSILALGPLACFLGPLA